jgi:hypothetical protein
MNLNKIEQTDAVNRSILPIGCYSNLLEIFDLIFSFGGLSLGKNGMLVFNFI